MVKKRQTIDFEASITALENIVEKMEKGEFTLEESVRQFQRGIVLARDCQNALQQAEQTVKQLAGTTGADAELVPFRPGDEDEKP